MSPKILGIPVLIALFSAVPALAQDAPEETPEVTAPPGAPKAPPPPRPRAHARAEDPELPAVRAVEGNWGMFFRFGGLATLDAGNNTRQVNNLLLTQIGMRAVVTDELIVPFYFGAGFSHISAANSNATITDVGFDMGAGFEYHFRVWRRISPFVGGGVGLSILEPSGDTNTTIGIGLGPTMGIEYYVADRVSLIAQYFLTFQANIAPDRFTGISFTTLSGGAMNLVFYF